MFLHVDSQDSDQTGFCHAAAHLSVQLPRLIGEN